MREIERGLGGLLSAGDRVAGGWWRALAWFGSLGLGLSLFMLLARGIHFEYHSFEDIIATSAFQLYPEQQDWWLYVFAIAAVSFGTILGYAIWGCLGTWFQKAQSASEPPYIRLATILYLVWWVDPLTFLISHHFATLSAYDLGVAFTLVNMILLGHAWLQGQCRSKSQLAPPPLSLLAAVAVLGAFVGISLLVSPLGTWFLGAPIWTVLGSALGTVLLWMGGTFLWARNSLKSWEVLAGKAAIALLPLSVLPLLELF